MAASPGPNDDEASGGCNRGEEAETNPETPQNASGVDSIGGEEAVTRFAKKQNAPGGRGGEEAETRSTTGGNAAPGGNGEEEVGQWKEKTLSLEKTVAVLQARVQELERAVEKERKERAAERTGRIRAEQQLRSRLLAPAAAEPESPVRAHGALAAELPEEGGAHGDARDGGHSDGHGDGNSVSESDARDQSEGCDVAVTQHGRQSTGEQHGQEEHGHGSVGLTTYPMTPIGVIRSCFSARNGTPRQPLLVPAARAYLELPRGGVAPAALQGLEGYSHCWLLYVFHANTDIQRLWSDPHYRKFRAKVRVPRLQGGKLGALATRTPHRPVPIGLSIAKVERVEGRRVFLSGADLVDGTPMLDIKPYLPYSDALPSATVPRWVEPSGEGDGMHMASVTFHSAVSTQLQDAWSSQSHRSLYSHPDELQELCRQVLTRDIRSASHQKSRMDPSSTGMSSHSSGHGITNPEHESTLSESTQKSKLELPSMPAGAESAAVTVPCNAGFHDVAQVASVSSYDPSEDRNGEAKPVGGADSASLVYHVILDGIDFSYVVLDGNHVVVEGARPSP